VHLKVAAPAWQGVGDTVNGGNLDAEVGASSKFGGGAVRGRGSALNDNVQHWKQCCSPPLHAMSCVSSCAVVYLSCCVCVFRYINKPHDKAGTAVKLVVRGKANDATVTKMPFVKTTYYKPS
jgi:glycine cleavage system aminomethyltransferase T